MAPDELLRVSETGIPMTIGAEPGPSSPVSQLALPLARPADGLNGVLVVAVNPQRPLDRPFDEFVTLIATTVTRALDTAHRHSSELGEYRHISDTLQASMLQPAVDLPTIAARYLPAVARLAVGGDWYDVIDLEPKGRGLVVGDCVGHGLAAATVMAQLRVATRALLLEGRDPAATLAALDVFAQSVDGAYCASVLCAIFDRQAGTSTCSRAGHPPALVIHGTNQSGLTPPPGSRSASTSTSPRERDVRRPRG